MQENEISPALVTCLGGLPALSQRGQACFLKVQYEFCPGEWPGTLIPVEYNRQLQKAVLYRQELSFLK